MERADVLSYEREALDHATVHRLRPAPQAGEHDQLAILAREQVLRIWSEAERPPVMSHPHVGAESSKP